MPETKALTRKAPPQTNNKSEKPKLINFKQRFMTLSNQKTKTKARITKAPQSPPKNKSQIIIIKPDKVATHADFTPNSTNITLSPILPATPKTDELALVAQSQAALVGFDEINKLIKKLTLSFSSQKSESSFLIKTGVFEGARFHVRCQEKDLHLKINNLATDAHQLLGEHQDYLRLRLSHKEINLASIMFNS